MPGDEIITPRGGVGVGSAVIVIVVVVAGRPSGSSSSLSSGVVRVSNGDGKTDGGRSGSGGGAAGSDGGDRGRAGLSGDGGSGTLAARSRTARSCRSDAGAVPAERNKSGGDDAAPVPVPAPAGGGGTSAGASGGCRSPGPAPARTNSSTSDGRGLNRGRSPTCIQGAAAVNRPGGTFVSIKSSSVFPVSLFAWRVQNTGPKSNSCCIVHGDRVEGASAELANSPVANTRSFPFQGTNVRSGEAGATASISRAAQTGIPNYQVPSLCRTVGCAPSLPIL